MSKAAQSQCLPFKPILFRFSDAMDSLKSSSECLSPESTPLTSTCSHSIGTLSALKTVLTDSATSAPMPSPGMSVAVYLPPYLVGLKMSEDRVARPRFALKVLEGLPPRSKACKAQLSITAISDFGALLTLEACADGRASMIRRE